MSSARIKGRDRVTLVGILVLLVVFAFQEMAVITVLPTAARELHGIGSFGWLFTGYLAAKIVGLVLAGQYCGTHGPRPVLAAALALSVAGLVIGGTAPVMEVLIAGRVVQGLGGGLLITTVYVLIGQAFPEAVVPKVLSATVSAFVIPCLAGPLVAGALTQYVGWRSAFLVLVPVALAASALLLPVVRGLGRPEVPAPRRNSLRYALAVAAAVAVLEHVGQHPPHWPVFAPVALLAGSLLVWGLRALLPSGAYRMRRGVAAPVALRGIYSGVLEGVAALVPLLLMLQHGYSPTAAALPLAAAVVFEALGSWLQSRPPRGDERDYRVRLVRAGFALTMLAALVAALVARPSIPGWWMFAAWAAAGTGAGMVFTTFNVLVMRQTTDADRGFDSAALQLAGATGEAITTGLGGVLVAAAARGTLGYTTAFTGMNLAMAALMVLGIVAVGRLRPLVPGQLAIGPTAVRPRPWRSVG